MIRPFLDSGIALLAAAALASCSSDPRRGYSFQSAYDREISTVYVPMIQNSTFTRGVEVELTDAVVKEIQRSTPWRPTSEAAAQTTLTATIVNSRIQSLSTGRTSGLVQEQAVILTIDFDWKDNRTGKVLVARRNFSVADSFVPALNVAERLETGQNAAVQQLAKDLVAELRSSW
jgi:hypothetical protein